MTRMALKSAGPIGAITGGLIAYGAATVVVVSLLAFSATLGRNIMLLRRDDISWFVYSGGVRGHCARAPLFGCGCAILLVGASAVAVDTNIILNALALPDELARALAWQF